MCFHKQQRVLNVIHSLNSMSNQDLCSALFTGNGGDQEERKIPIQCSGIEMKEKLARLMTNI